MNVFFNLFLLNITFLVVALIKVEAQSENSPNIPYPRNESPLPKIILGVKPARTIADTAQEYWIENNCIYPPKTFFSLFRDACEVKLQAQTFSAGICQAFFNSSKKICRLEDVEEEEVQTMLSIRELQKTMDDDALCDTLAEMKQNNPTLFPKMADFTGKEEWFRSISSLIFTPETCSHACQMDNMHPICFGYMLNYNHIGSLPSLLAEEEDERENEEIINEEEETESENNELEKNKTSTSTALTKEDEIASNLRINFEPDDKASSDPLQPNPKLVGAKTSDLEHDYFDADPEFDNEDINSDLLIPDMLNKTPVSLVDILGLDSIALDDNISPEDTDEDFEFDSEIAIENLPQYTDEFLMKIGRVPIARHRLRGYVQDLDRSDEMPMLGFVLAMSGLLAVICFFLLFSVRKKIGVYMKYARQKHRNNWNYERVFAVQPDDDDYYE